MHTLPNDSVLAPPEEGSSIKICAILLVLCCVLSDRAHGAELTLDDLFPTDHVLDIQITLPEEDWETIRNQRRQIENSLNEARRLGHQGHPYTYFTADVTIDGVPFPRVGVRKKGFVGSLSSIRPSLKIKLDYTEKKADVGGLNILTFNNNRQDETQLSAFLGYAFFNAAGVPAPRCSLAKITVNGQNLGIYSHVETPRKPLLKRGFGTSKGSLFESTVSDFFDGWEKSFEIKVGKKKRGTKRLAKLIESLEGEPGEVLLSEEAQGRALVPTNGDVDDQWMRPEFDDSTWITGRNGAGFETQEGYESQISEEFNFQSQLHRQGSSVYLRFPFETADPNALPNGRLVLKVKYDDGFVAYLNGHRVAAGNAPEQIAWDSRATGSHDDPAALQFALFDISEHADKIQAGANLLAIHGMNLDPGSTDMLTRVELELNDFDYIEAIQKVVDLDAFYRFWAVEGLLNFWDGYSGNRNNFFVYVHPKTDKVHFLPWGADCLFQRNRLFQHPQSPQTVLVNGRLAHVLYQDELSRERYVAAMTQILTDVWNEEELVAEVDRVAAMIKPHLSVSQSRRFRVDRLKEFITNRRSEAVKEMTGGLPQFANAPKPPPIISAEERARRERERQRRFEADTLANATRKGDVAGIQRHLEKGAEINRPSEFGLTPLSLASMVGNLEIIKLLLEKGALVNPTQDDRSLSSLHSAALLGHKAVVQLLIESGANVNVETGDGRTPLDLATMDWEESQGWLEWVSGQNGVKVDQRRVRTERIEGASLLTEHGGKPGVRRPRGGEKGEDEEKEENEEEKDDKEAATEGETEDEKAAAESEGEKDQAIEDEGN